MLLELADVRTSPLGRLGYSPARMADAPPDLDLTTLSPARLAGVAESLILVDLPYEVARS